MYELSTAVHKRVYRGRTGDIILYYVFYYKILFRTQREKYIVEPKCDAR